MENWNSANGALFYGKDRELTGADRDSQEISVLALHLLQSALVYVNTLLLQRILADQPIDLTAEDRRALTPAVLDPRRPLRHLHCTSTGTSTSTPSRSAHDNPAGQLHRRPARRRNAKPASWPNTCATNDPTTPTSKTSSGAARRTRHRDHPQPKTLPYVPSEDEIRRYYQTVWQARRSGDMVLIKTLLYTGVRVAELVAIGIDDVDLDAYQIRITHGKGGKDRVVPFPQTFRETLALHIADRHKTGGPTCSSPPGRSPTPPAACAPCSPATPTPPGCRTTCRPTGCGTSCSPGSRPKASTTPSSSPTAATPAANHWRSTADSPSPTPNSYNQAIGRFPVSKIIPSLRLATRSGVPGHYGQSAFQALVDVISRMPPHDGSPELVRGGAACVVASAFPGDQPGAHIAPAHSHARLKPAFPEPDTSTS